MTTTREYTKPLMTIHDIADAFNVSHRRALYLVRDRNRQLGVGVKLAGAWLVHRDELELLRPDEKYRKGKE